jgi:hypothetical protein
MTRPSRYTTVVGMLLVLNTASTAQPSPKVPGGIGLDTWTRGLGIDAGEQGPPGLFLIYRLIDFTANKSRDRNGDLQPIPGLKIGARAHALAFLFTAKPHDGPYLNAVLSLPLGVTSLHSGAPPAAFNDLGLTDIFVSPLRVGWRQPHFDVVTSYGFYAPTGRFRPDDPASIGRGYWINQLCLGGAAYVDTARRNRASVLVAYEKNQRRREVDARRGDLLNVQGGAGATVYNNVVAGLAAYALWQVSDDKGTYVPALTAGRTRAFGLGPEIDLTIPKLRARVDLRAEWDFGVVAHPQGVLLVVGAEYLAWMPPIKTGASPPPRPAGKPDSQP